MTSSNCNACRYGLLIVALFGIPLTASGQQAPLYPPLPPPVAHGSGAYVPQPPSYLYRAPALEHPRSGWLLGLAPGGAIGDSDRNQTGALVSVYAGYFLHPRLAFMLEANVFESDRDIAEYEPACISDCGSASGDTTAAFLGVWGPAVQFWLSNRLWLRGMAGYAEADLVGLGEVSGVGWSGAMGIDVVSSRAIALDLRVNALGGLFEEGASARVGFALGFTLR